MKNMIFSDDFDRFVEKIYNFAMILLVHLYFRRGRVNVSFLLYLSLFKCV